MADAVRKASGRPILKIKLGAPEGDLERIAAVRAAAPDATLIADANEGWSGDTLDRHLAACAEAGVALIEQPLPAAKDEALRRRPAAGAALRRRERARPSRARPRLSGSTTRSTSSSTRPAA